MQTVDLNVMSPRLDLGMVHQHASISSNVRKLENSIEVTTQDEMHYDVARDFRLLRGRRDQHDAALRGIDQDCILAKCREEISAWDASTARWVRPGAMPGPSHTRTRICSTKG
ncbi:hypothetical protein [Paracoccus actinidiae]|jgi:hypothetical protein|uniref:hypothetical protein n=1 Tax=Paracoccus actinidiae TaxID=3064531 RepID=UPI0027D31AD0|nr:hypothetical protein [Paracoccus sp. M09]